MAEMVLGAGVVAGTVYYGLALREQHKERQAFLRRDQQIMQVLGAGGAAGSLPESLQNNWQWLLLVHVHEVEILDSRLEAAAVSVLVKYGHPSRSLRRETHWMRVLRDEEDKLGATHHETFVFAWNTEVAPYLRFRLRKMGRLTRTIAKAVPTSVVFARRNGQVNLVREEELPLLGMSDRQVATVKVVYEARCVELRELYQYGFQVGNVVSHIGLEGADVPLVQGVGVDEAPAIGELPPDVAGHVVPETPAREDGAESELESVAGGASVDGDSLESGSSSAESDSEAEPTDTAEGTPRPKTATRKGRSDHPICGCCR